MRAFQSLGKLDGGVEITINGKTYIMCVPTLCYVGDMPQQNKNSGFRCPKAHKFCRFCYIGEQAVKSGNPNAILDFNIMTHGRSHHQYTAMREDMDTLQTAMDRNQYGTTWGLDKKTPALPSITPALDLILSRPPQPSSFGVRRPVGVDAWAVDERHSD